MERSENFIYAYVNYLTGDITDDGTHEYWFRWSRKAFLA